MKTTDNTILIAGGGSASDAAWRFAKNQSVIAVRNSTSLTILAARKPLTMNDSPHRMITNFGS